MFQLIFIQNSEILLQRSRRSTDTAAEREQRLENDTFSHRVRRSTETVAEREQRLENVALSQRSRRSTETAAERQLRRSVRSRLFQIE